MLYEAKLDPHAANAAGESVLFHLVEAFPLDSLQRILPLADFDLHAIDAHGRSLLFPAAMNYGHFSLNFEVFYWLEKTQGLDPKIHDKTGKSLLHAAILDEYLPTFIQYLVEVAGLDPNEPDAEGRTPIQEAEALGDALLIQYLRNSKNTIYTRST